MQYTSKDKLKSGVPLGGIGAGKVEILPNGTLDFLTFANNFDNPTTDNPHPDREHRSVAKGVIGYHFGISTKYKNKRVAKLLQTQKISDYPCVKAIDFKGLFPSAQLDYQDQDLACDISLDAFSPFSPGESIDSAIPGIIFEFTITNPQKYEIEASLFACARNTVGRWSVSRYNQLRSQGALTSIEFKKKNALPSDYTDGTFSLSMPKSCGEISYFSQWNLQNQCFVFDRKNISIQPWEYFAQTGHLPNVDNGGPSENESIQIAGALCCKDKIAPNASKKVRVIYSWHFPHKERSHIYENHFKDANSVSVFLEDNHKKLRRKITNWHNSIEKLKGPTWLKEAVINNCYCLYSASWWDKKNRFAISEAPCDITLMGTLDVRYYDSVYRALLFPDLEKIELLEFAKAQRGSGYITHDLGRARVDLPSNGTTFYLWKDLVPKYILMAYRNFIWHKDKKELKKLYPSIKRSFKWIVSTDKNRDLLPDNAGLDQTFDVWEFHGTNSYTSSVFLVSLLALRKIALAMGDNKFAGRLNEHFKKAKKAFCDQLWNGKYFIACNNNGKKDIACTLGQINGQWYAHLLGLGYIVDKDKIRKAIKSILSLNVKDTKFGATNSVFLNGKRDYSSLHSKNIWAGETYAFSALAIYEGFTKEALALTKKMWNTVSKTQVSPWDQPDMFCPDTGRALFGDHYMRNMVISAVLLALQKK